MWANAQRDGHPAKYRWRPLFNAPKCGWRPILECRAVRLPRRETHWNLQGVPQTTRLISAASGPKFTILCGHVGEILVLNKFFSDCRYVPQLQRYSPTKLCDAAQMAIFWRFFASCICSEPHVARFRPASYICTKATPCVEVWQTSNLRRLRLGEEKKDSINDRMKI